MKFLW